MSIFEYNKEEEEKKLRRAEYEAGRKDGKREGKKEGIFWGEQRLSALLAGLLRDGKNEEMQKVVTDVSFREKMYEKYNL